MPRLPDVQSMGSRDIPGAPRQLVGALSAASEGDAAIGQSVAQSGQMLQQAADRSFTRQDAIQRAKIASSFDAFAADSLAQLETERDISDLDTVREFGQMLSAKQQELLSSHKGSADSRAQLAVRLEDERARFSGEIAGRSLRAQAEIADQYMNEQQNKLVNSVYDDPSSYEVAVAAWNNEVAEMSGVYRPGQERALQIGGAAELVKSAAQGLLDRGAYDESESFLSREDIQPLLTPDSRRQFRTRITVQRVAEEKEAQQLQRQQRMYEAFLWRALTSVEKVRMLGIEAPAGPVTTSQKLAEAEAVLGRPLTEAEILEGYKLTTGGAEGGPFGGSLAGRTLNIMGELSEGHAAGILSPEEERQFQASITEYTQPRTIIDPETGLRVETRPELPGFVQEALNRRPLSGMPAPGAAEPAEDEPIPGPLNVGSQQSFWDQASRITGPVSGAASVANRMPGLGGIMPDMFGEMARARQEWPLVQREVTTALRNNPRFAEGERTDIERDLAISSSFFDNEQAFRDRMAGVDDALAVRERNARAVATSERASLSERQKANDILDLIVPVRQKLGVPPFVANLDQARIMLEQGTIRPGQQVRTPAGIMIAPDPQSMRAIEEQGDAPASP